MTRAATPPTLLQIQSPDSIETQIASLRALKNELIGHDQRKETYVAAGIIPVLAQVLASQWPGKPSTAESLRAVPNRALGSDELAEDLEACLQAILIVASLAQGMYCPSGLKLNRKMGLIMLSRRSNVPRPDLCQRHRVISSDYPVLAGLPAVVLSSYPTPPQHDCRSVTITKPRSVASGYTSGR